MVWTHFAEHYWCCKVNIAAQSAAEKRVVQAELAQSQADQATTLHWAVLHCIRLSYTGQCCGVYVFDAPFTPAHLQRVMLV